MKHVITDYIRQAEILAFALNGEEYSKSDLSEIYEVSEITINRDLNALRDAGIQIFSRRGKIEILTPPLKETLILAAADYLPLTLNSDVFVKQVRTFSKYKDYYPILVLLAKAVRESRKIKIRYKRFKDDKLNEYKLTPVRLYAERYNWILDAVKDGEEDIKMFYLSRMLEVKLTHEYPKKLAIPQKKQAIHEVKLKFVPDVKGQLLDKIWFEDAKLETDEQGYTILTVKTSINRRLAAWCITWEDSIEIVSPIELKNFIKCIINKFSHNNHL